MEFKGASPGRTDEFLANVRRPCREPAATNVTTAAQLSVRRRRRHRTRDLPGPAAMTGGPTGQEIGQSVICNSNSTTLRIDPRRICNSPGTTCKVPPARKVRRTGTTVKVASIRGHQRVVAPAKSRQILSDQVALSGAGPECPAQSAETRNATFTAQKKPAGERSSPAGEIGGLDRLCRPAGCQHRPFDHTVFVTPGTAHGYIPSGPGSTGGVASKEKSFGSRLISELMASSQLTTLPE